MTAMVRSDSNPHLLPGLAPDFWSIFTSKMVDAGDGVCLHTVSGGQGAPLLLINGWPCTWYASRRLMQQLVRDFRVIVVEQRGVGLSDKPVGVYDSGSLAKDLAGVMAALGHERFFVAAEDVGAWTGYALAADFPDKVIRYVHAEVVTPGLTDDIPLLMPDTFADLMWHMPFNRSSGDIRERMVEGREDIYFSHQFATKAKSPTSISTEAVSVYVEALRQPEALRASFDFYRAIGTNIEQNERRRLKLLQMPVLALGGPDAAGPMTVTEMEMAAANSRSCLLPGAGHFIFEEDAERVAATLREFLLGGEN